ncbi:maltose alpha-D-glucosyltransferase [Deminuibacter soli]|uniref:maltose alpha-D-glucosyltransferase n=1 Tax=Deminuibacter soli TaxID=2291815 RepID=A0A3E1NQF1_9BACT|nr:maltose alpha-D-glucosyltransferase [Deminuibacter soli]RFM30156.1 maltose alpha-D-glucosyltransferase [Deminuibacter soli]
MNEQTELDDQLHWYKDAIIYELHIKAFCDGNGDGIGDFQGLMQKLDYLQELGVTAIWLLPFYPSPQRDDGYDIADYYNINPAYGNIHQFKQLLKEAHKRSLKVITELVINHTSDQHPWFQRARMAPKNSPERDYYVWTDDPNQYKDVRIIFQDFETSNWTWDPLAQQYYWHRFFHHQPDLNYDNPVVQEEIFKIIDYWCRMGVDGFRLDAVPYLFEREGTNGENLPETHAFLKKMRRHIDTHFPGTLFLAEANMWPEDAAAYFGEGDECHMNYHFPVMPRMFMALQMEDRYPVTDIFDQTPAIPDVCQWAIFLRNHDELTLEMVTDEERDYMYKAYAKDPKARINLGIRHRLAPLVDNNRRKIELLNCLLFTLPGTPVIYYGDEIGMGDNFYLGDRDGVRTPMQWSPDRNAGFSSANPQRLYLPLILDPAYHYEAVNVETQRENTSSLFWVMKSMIGMRKKYKAFGRGDLKFLNVENPKILAFTRSYQEQTLLIVVNLSKFSQAAEVDLSAYKGNVLREMASKNKFPSIKDDSPYFFTMTPHGFQAFVLEKAHPEVDDNAPLPELNIASWEQLLQNSTRDRLENELLPAYLLKAKWFSGRQHAIYTITITNHATVSADDHPIYWLLLEVSYQSSLPEMYQLPVTFASAPQSGKLASNCPQSIIARMRLGEAEGVLCDAFFTAPLQHELIKRMTNNKHLALNSSEIVLYGNNEMKKYWGEHKDEIKSRIHASDQFNTSITYDNLYFLKMYRKVDRSINPDLEVTRFLTEQAKFPYIPAFIGAIEWKYDTIPIVLGIMQEMIENHGDGHSYVMERMHNYVERIKARDRNQLHPEQRVGSLVNPLPYEHLPEMLQVLLGNSAAEQARLLGVRTGQMHLALASDVTNKDFKPEEFSLHYQRSLFASMVSLVRETYHRLNRAAANLDGEVKPAAESLLNKRTELLGTLKHIYDKKLDVLKIRIHGNFQLGQVLLTGKDLAIQDYGGEASQRYSERRLKRSPLKDVASMVSSLHYAAHEAFRNDNHIQKEELPALLPFANYWWHHISGIFIYAWLDTVKNTALIPAEQDDQEMLLQNFMLQQALEDLNTELQNNRTDWLTVPLDMIAALLTPQKEKV